MHQEGGENQSVWSPRRHHSSLLLLWLSLQQDHSLHRSRLLTAGAKVKVHDRIVEVRETLYTSGLYVEVSRVGAYAVQV